MDLNRKQRTLDLMKKLGSNEMRPEDLTPEEREELQAQKEDEDRENEAKNTKTFSKRLLSKLPNPFQQ